MTRKNRLTTQGQGGDLPQQHKAPCIDCPMARTALPGWLGGRTPEEYRTIAHSSIPVPCHVHSNQQCAGMAIYRTNVCQRADFKLPSDTERVFGFEHTFMDHHKKGPKQ